MVALLRDRLYQAHTQYEHLGYFPIDAREVVEDMFKQYITLGGNGIVKHLKEALDAYRRKYGCGVEFDNYIIMFEPYLAVIQRLE